MGKPLVSIGLPTRGRVESIKTAIDSLLGQTYKNIELIISDNASTDGTEIILKEYAARDSRIRYIRQERNIGGIANHEFVLKQSKGLYFMWASDDDSWYPRFVEALVNTLEHNPDYGVAMSHYYQRLINLPEGGEKRTLRAHNLTDDSYQQVYKMYLHQIGYQAPIFFFGLYRTDLLKRIMRRRTPVSSQGPVLFLCEVALVMRCFSVPEPLHVRVQDARSRILRHPDHPFALAEEKPFALTHYLFLVLFWLITSPAIPLSRKHLIFGPWFCRVWFKKRKIFLETMRFFRKLFRFGV